jgi:hypothetical protein
MLERPLTPEVRSLRASLKASVKTIRGSYHGCEQLTQAQKIFRRTPKSLLRNARLPNAVGDKKSLVRLIFTAEYPRVGSNH